VVPRANRGAWPAAVLLAERAGGVCEAHSTEAKAGALDELHVHTR
jgi:hypothetical protein